MSGPPDHIVQRRRTSASSPPGAPAEIDAPDVNGAAPPQPERADTNEAEAPGLRERGRIRRRIRYLERLRDLQLRDLGGFVLEARRLGRPRPELVEQKLEAAAATERELRTLERALGERRTLRELREPGIGGACAQCGTVYGSSDRFCSSCGRKL